MRSYASILAFLGLAAAAGVASADDNDLVLSRLGTIDAAGTSVIPDNQDFRSLASELGVIIAPKFLTPADTLGFSGFQFSTEIGYTSINSENHYWCATEESANCGSGFQKGGMVQTVGLFARKGMWLPLPSFEIGAGAVHVASSRLWAGQAYAKFAIHEGFHDLPIPSVAVRFAGSRLMGTEQLDLTVASLDIAVSKRFAVQGTFTVAPFVGWNVLWIVPRSQVIDKTPNTAVKDSPNDIKMNFVFPDQDTIVRQRLFAGAKLKYYVFSLSLEVDYAFGGGTVDNRNGTSMPCDMASASQLGNCDATDHSGGQTTYSTALSLDF